MKYLGTEFAVGSKEITAQNMLDSGTSKLITRSWSLRISKLALYQSVLRVCDQTKENFILLSSMPKRFQTVAAISHFLLPTISPNSIKLRWRRIEYEI